MHCIIGSLTHLHRNRNRWLRHQFSRTDACPPPDSTRTHRTSPSIRRGDFRNSCLGRRPLRRCMSHQGRSLCSRCNRISDSRCSGLYPTKTDTAGESLPYCRRNNLREVPALLALQCPGNRLLLLWNLPFRKSRPTEMYRQYSMPRQHLSCRPRRNVRQSPNYPPLLVLPPPVPEAPLCDVPLTFVVLELEQASAERSIPKQLNRAAVFIQFSTYYHEGMGISNLIWPI
jgi:hypothetical protein